jgi:hypothetical protein
MIDKLLKIKNSLDLIILKSAECDNNLKGIVEQRARIRDIRVDLKKVTDLYLAEKQEIQRRRRADD